ncbi:uncharacterized protein [Arachis hypogaea]|uniref:uncharacterized protein n=1 Tax=Arachis hypogaea TaxID=3818 RepID=UPI003B211907
MPFKLVFRADAMILVEISQGSIRADHFDEDTNNQMRSAEMDIIDEERQESRIRQEYNKKVRPHPLQQGDLVPRRLEDVRRPPRQGKLAANWEDPYRISQVHGRGAYSLEALEGIDLPNTWNISSLRLYHT